MDGDPCVGVEVGPRVGEGPNSPYMSTLNLTGEVLNLPVGAVGVDLEQSYDAFAEDSLEIYWVEYSGIVGYLGLLKTYCIISLRGGTLHSINSYMKSSSSNMRNPATILSWLLSVKLLPSVP